MIIKSSNLSIFVIGYIPPLLWLWKEQSFKNAS